MVLLIRLYRGNKMTDTKKNVYQKLLEVQKEARAPRSIPGRFGNARSAEQILEAYKPICINNGLYLQTSDTIHSIGNRNYVKSTAMVVSVDDPTQFVSACAEAWEGEAVGGLDTSQVSGKTSSYAKKYALQNLFAIDDSKDADFEHNEEETKDTFEDTNQEEDKLAEYKSNLNEKLELQGYDNKVKKLIFIKQVLGKDRVETLEDADLIDDALNNGKED